MELHFFAIRATDPRDAQDELNRFCAGRRVVAVDRQLVQAGLESFWAVCVTVAPGAGPLPDVLKTPENRSGARGNGAAASRVDYKQVLNDADFALFAGLRAWRKEVAGAEGVPVYAVFTNEQLAEVARRRVGTLAALGEIEGVGPARVQRYGQAVLDRVRAAPAGAETDQEPCNATP